MIVIVDDAVDLAKALGKLLQRQGYSVQCIANGQDALAFMEIMRPEMVILDQHLPDQKGVEVLHRMRQKGTLRDVPVLFFSAEDPGEAADEAMRYGALAWVTKDGHGWRSILDAAEGICQHPS